MKLYHFATYGPRRFDGAWLGAMVWIDQRRK
jgi:hypothetical protein